MDIELENLAKKLPDHLIIQKRLWVRGIYVDIEHVDNDLDKPLDYISAFKKMIDKLEDTEGG